MAVNGISRRYLGLFVVLALALLSWWFQRQESSPGVGQQGSAHVVDYSMSDFEVTAMDEAGRPRHRLRAVLMEHYADDGSAELEQPQLLLYLPAGPTAATAPSATERWSLRAERARLYNDGSVALLEGAVQAQHVDGSDKVLLELQTRDLWVYVDEQRAESDQLVEIRERHGITRAQGLKIDLKAGQIELLAAVRGEYVRER
ncbi:MAG: LPS export ABC transporter periplasmic protein LptC [Pseudomonadota bacterium]|nr:LPS export ABC transporter periplasmic protein LptC [Pseudomonadota bacterium]